MSFSHVHTGRRAQYHLRVHHHGRKHDDGARDPDAVDHHEHDPIVELEYYRSGVSAEIIAAKLKANDIPCFTQRSANGLGLGAYSGLGQTSEAVFVFQSDLARARVLAEQESA
jgi:hypothetical protein